MRGCDGFCKKAIFRRRGFPPKGSSIRGSHAPGCLSPERIPSFDLDLVISRGEREVAQWVNVVRRAKRYKRGIAHLLEYR